MPKLIYKNYRAFADENPLIIELGTQFTALLGPNNSGKSSFLLSFFELRSLWSQLTADVLPRMFRTDGRIACDYQAVQDYIEIFHNGNSRSISVEVQITPSRVPFGGSSHLTRLVAICDRSATNNWRFEMFANTTPVHFESPQLSAAWVQRPYPSVLNVPNVGQIDCTEMLDAISMFANTLYIGPFRSVISEVTGPYYDLAIGHSFIATWNQWKVGRSKAHNLAIDSITNNIKEIFKFGSLEINPDADGKALHVRLDGKPFRLAELGAGLSQFIIVFANAAIRQPRLILIDEPELNLHPTLQTAFLTALASYSKDGVLFATHSVGLARSTADRIYSFRKSGIATEVRDFETTASYAEFLGEMSFAAYQETGYDSILLVEGVNDVLTLHQFLRMLHKEHRVVVFPLHGNELAAAGRELELGEIRRLSKNIFALVDSERGKAEDPPDEKREAFQKICEKLRIPVRVTDRRAIENYLSDHAVKAAFGDKYRALTHFERLADAIPSWKKAESWRAARQMSRQDIEGTDVFMFLETL